MNSLINTTKTTALEQRRDPANLIPSTGVVVRIVPGPFTEFSGAVVCLDRTHLFGVFGDMTKAPQLEESGTIKIGDRKIEVFGDGSKLACILNEDWKRDDNKKVGTSQSVREGLDVASDLGCLTVVVPLPSCASQYYFRWIIYDFDEAMEDQLHPEEIDKFRSVMLGVKQYLDDTDFTSIREIIFVYDPAYPVSSGARSTLDILRALPADIAKLPEGEET